MAEISDRIRYLRDEKNITQARLAEIIGVKWASIQRYESGEIKPTLDNLKKLADYFDVNMDYLIGRSDNPARI